MANILVTGGAGYIGSHAAKALINHGHKVVVIDNLSTGFKDSVPAEASFIHCDIQETEKIRQIVRKENIQAIMHFAAKLIIPESLANPYDYYLTNTLAVLNLAKICVEENVLRFVFSSTASVYGNSFEGEVIPENSTPEPISPYSQSKLMGEQILKDFDRAYGLKSIVLRYFNVAGSASNLTNGQKTKNATHLIKVAAEVAANKRPGLEIFGQDYPTTDGTCIRDYVHVEDLALAHVLALDYLLSEKKSDLFNCGYGHGFSVKQVVEMMKSVTNNQFKVAVTGRRPGDVARLVADNKKIKNILGWNPSYDKLDFICKSAFDWETKA